jgi:hypothetical protein
MDEERERLAARGALGQHAKALDGLLPRERLRALGGRRGAQRARRCARAARGEEVHRKAYDAEGRGNDARVQVNFGRQGVKWLAVAVAKLQAA